MRTVLAVMEKKYCAWAALRGTPQPCRCITPRWNHASVLPCVVNHVKSGQSSGKLEDVESLQDCSRT